MGLTRSGLSNQRVTGGQRRIHRKKRKFELARPPANTKLVSGETRVRTVRCRGGNLKFRALRLENGNFAWGTHNITRKTRILDVVYNATSNELVRTKTLVKGCIVQIDATPFRNWYYKRYGIYLGKRVKGQKISILQKKVSDLTDQKRRHRATHRPNITGLESQFRSGRLLAQVKSSPGQVGRADGLILEGAALTFYQKKLEKKKKAK